MFYTDLPVAELGVLFEQWHLGVCWEVPGEVSVPFLDLWLEFDSDGYLTHKLYQKTLEPLSLLAGRLKPSRSLSTRLDQNGKTSNRAAKYGSLPSEGGSEKVQE